MWYAFMCYVSMSYVLMCYVHMMYELRFRVLRVTISTPYRPGGLYECAFLLLEEEESEEEKGESKNPPPLELT